MIKSYVGITGETLVTTGTPYEYQLYQDMSYIDHIIIKPLFHMDVKFMLEILFKNLQFQNKI